MHSLPQRTGAVHTSRAKKNLLKNYGLMQLDLWRAKAKWNCARQTNCPHVRQSNRHKQALQEIPKEKDKERESGREIDRAKADLAMR